MAKYRKILIILIIPLLMATFLAIYVSNTLTTTTDLVVNGGFEDGMNGWGYGPRPLAPGIDIVNIGPRNNSHSLRLIGGGVGFLQNLTHRSIFPRTQLSFYTLLNNTEVKEPQALFHLYFLSNPPDGMTYYVDIIVTPNNNEDLAAVFNPPGTKIGGIYLRFNREPQRIWINISVDISKLIETYLPDLLDPQVNRIMLESAEGGQVYFTDISLNSTNFVYAQSLYLDMASRYFVNSTTSKTVTQLLGYSVIITAGFSICRWWSDWWKSRRTKTKC
jgi:hypothetical protein